VCEVTLAAAREVSFQDSRIARTIFALRALPGRLRGVPPAPTERRAVFEEVTALGWRQLVEAPGRQVIMGAVTQPWRQEVEFHGLPADEFVAFHEPGYAKIAWTLGGRASRLFVVAVLHRDTGHDHRSSQPRVVPALLGLLSPGILLIRYEILRLVKAETERRSASRSLISQTP
jgi:hypothetical protein